MPSPPVRRLRLAPNLLRSVGFFPVFFSAERSLGHGPVHTLPLPIQSLQFLVHLQTVSPQSQEHARFPPFLEPPVGRRTRTNPRGVQCIPLTSCPQNEQDRVHRLPR